DLPGRVARGDLVVAAVRRREDPLLSAAVVADVLLDGSVVSGRAAFGVHTLGAVLHRHVVHAARGDGYGRARGGRVEAVHDHAIREGADVHLAVGDRGRRELAEAAEAVAGGVLLRVPKLLRQVRGIEGADDTGHDEMLRILRDRDLGPHDPVRRA